MLPKIKPKNAFFKSSIAYLLWNTKQNGGNKIILTHVKLLQERGYNIKAVSILPGQPTWFAQSLKVQSLMSYLLKKPSQIIVATFWPTAYVARILPAKKKFYFIQNWEADFSNNNLFKLLATLSLRFPFKLLTISLFLANKLRRMFPRIPIFIIPNAVEPVYQKLNNSRDIKKVFVLSVCTTYSPYKGLDTLEYVIKKIKMIYPNKYFFTLVTTEKKPYSSVFDKFVRSPSVTQLVALYSQSDIFLHTSKIEGFPLPPLEAMACGCLVVATNSGGIAAYAKHLYNAILVKNQNELIRNNWIEKVSENKVLRKSLIENGLKTARKYNWDSIIDDLEKVLFQ